MSGRLSLYSSKVAHPVEVYSSFHIMKGNYSIVQKLYKCLSRNFNEIVPFWEILDQNKIVQHFAEFLRQPLFEFIWNFAHQFTGNVNESWNFWGKVSSKEYYTPLPLDWMLVHGKVTPQHSIRLSWKFASTHLYSFQFQFLSLQNIKTIKHTLFEH